MKQISGDDLEKLINKTFLQINNKYAIYDDILLKDIKKILLYKFKKINKSKKTEKKKRNQKEYNLFVKKYYKTINTDISQNEKFKNCAEIWHSMSKEEKDIYHNEAQLLKNSNEKAENIIKPKPKTKRKPSAYNNYYKKMSKELSKTKPHNITLMRHISNNWNSLSKDEKEKYIN